MEIGFIGVGKMGAPMAICLAKAGHDVRVFDTSQQALAGVAATDGITATPTMADAVRGAGGVVTMLPDGEAVRAVVEQMAGDLAPGAVLVDMSTSYPLETQALRDLVPAEIGLVDAPVSGGVWRAELGQLTIITGGADADVAKVEEALGAMGSVVRQSLIHI